jgi:hypothetical protein
MWRDLLAFIGLCALGAEIWFICQFLEAWDAL